MATLAANIDAGWQDSTLTFVVKRETTELGTGSATVTEGGSGLFYASATIDMSGFGAGVVDVLLIDDAGNLVYSESGYVDASGNYTQENTALTTLSAPVGTGGLLPLIFKGVSYQSSNGTAFEWTFTDPGTIATPGSNTCTFAGRKRTDATQTWSVAGALSNAASGFLKATFEFTTATIASLATGEYEWKVTCVDDNEDVILIATTANQRLTQVRDY